MIRNGILYMGLAAYMANLTGLSMFVCTIGIVHVLYGGAEIINQKDKLSDIHTRVKLAAIIGTATATFYLLIKLFLNIGDFSLSNDVLHVNLVSLYLSGFWCTFASFSIVEFLFYSGFLRRKVGS